VELARVLLGVAVGVADKRSLPLLCCDLVSHLILLLYSGIASLRGRGSGCSRR
jgi:hypothetical protein